MGKDNAKEKNESEVPGAEPANKEAETGKQTLDTLKTMLEVQEKEAKENYNQFLRALADLDNYKKRMAKEKSEFFWSAVVAVLEEMLPVADSLEKALAVPKDSAGYGDHLHKGLEITLKQFQKALEKFGVKSQDTAGKPFDPHFHEAIGHKDTDDLEPEMVAEEMQKGYLIEGKVLRPAKVRVSKPCKKDNIQNQKLDT